MNMRNWKWLVMGITLSFGKFVELNVIYINRNNILLLDNFTVTCEDLKMRNFQKIIKTKKR